MLMTTDLGGITNGEIEVDAKVANNLDPKTAMWPWCSGATPPSPKYEC
jgi:hypothetical protein